MEKLEKQNNPKEMDLLQREVDVKVLLEVH